VDGEEEISRVVKKATTGGLSQLPENKLREVIDAEELLRMQMSSKAFLDWLSPENDIYDEVFKNEVN